MFSLLYGVLPQYCFFETCKVKSVLKLYFEAVEQLFYIPLYQFSQQFPEQINAKQKLFFNSKFCKKVIPSLIIVFIFQAEIEKNNFAIKQ